MSASHTTAAAPSTSWRGGAGGRPDELAGGEGTGDSLEPGTGSGVAEPLAATAAVAEPDGLGPGNGERLDTAGSEAAGKLARPDQSGGGAGRSTKAWPHPVAAATASSAVATLRNGLRSDIAGTLHRRQRTRNAASLRGLTPGARAAPGSW